MRRALALAVLLAASPACAEPVAAVLIAGDASLDVFDNATDRLAADLARGDAHVARLSAAPRPGAASATRAHVLAAVAAMRPAPGGSCLVFATSHGVHGQGLYLAPEDEVLPPAELDRALRQGCGDAPTAIVISACYSGVYARPPMTRPNRIVFTAARADRPSFGCGADRVFTFFDECLLAAVEQDAAWEPAIADTRACVGAAEAREGERPSMPQASVGAAMRGARLPRAE
jgi:hypothetical protein